MSHAAVAVARSFLETRISNFGFGFQTAYTYPPFPESPPIIAQPGLPVFDDLDVDHEF